MTERALATVRRVADIQPIPNADAIECITIDGWEVVSQKGLYDVGDHVIYLEIDSWVPHEIAPFLSKGKEPRVYNGVSGERLKTVKLRGQVSQGLLLPIDEIEKIINDDISRIEGEDLTELLNIQKWERPIPAQLSGRVKGNFPIFIPKTDESRIQNMGRQFQKWAEFPSDVWEVTEKLDGSSMTVYHRDGDTGVCSRNYDLDFDENNSFWQAAINQELVEKLTRLGWNYAIQGELVGEGIQNNRYNLKGVHFFLYNVFNIDTQQYLNPYERVEFCSFTGIDHIPILEDVTTSDFVNDIKGTIASAEGKSVLNQKAEREGLVFKSACGQRSFKAISNKFLLKGGD